MTVSGLLMETVMRRALTSISLSAALFSAMPVQAHLVEIEIRGHIAPSQVGTMAPGLEEGMPVFLEMVYESTIPRDPFTISSAYYRDSIVTGTVAVGAYTGSFVTEGSEIRIVDNQFGTTDRFSVWSYLDIPGFDDPYILFTLVGPSTTWEGDDLPAHFPASQMRDPSLNNLDPPGWAAWITFVSDGQGAGQTGFFTMASITSPVPEPGTWAVMLGGLAFTAFALQRRSKRH